LPKVPGDGCAVVVVGKKQAHKTGVLLHDCLTAVREKGAKVLYLAAEGGHGIKTRRLPAYCKRQGVSLADLRGKWWTFSSSPNLLDEVELEAFLEHCAENDCKPDIVVIDTLTRATGDADICSPSVGSNIVTAMERMAQGFGGATVIGVTHPPKNAKGDAAIGSVQLENLAYAVLRVKREEDGVVQLTVHAMKDGPADHVISFQVEGGGDETDEPPVVVETGAIAARGAAKAKNALRQQQVLEALATFGTEGASYSQWEEKAAEIFKIPKGGSFNRAKNALVELAKVLPNGEKFVASTCSTPLQTAA
jgi:hypothetical protein